VYIACGYELPDERIKQLNAYLDEKKATKIDINSFLSALTYLKELELISEQENESDEYLDAFIGLGGEPNREGTISKGALI
tara:strand:+ start:53 stop:295 length:243 start_codon:yes stop_codon:yes gene_type:complete